MICRCGRRYNEEFSNKCPVCKKKDEYKTLANIYTCCGGEADE